MKLISQPDPKATEATRRRYERIAPMYDLMEALPEQRYQSWRQRLWSLVEGPEVLEVGVGTGKNMPYYPGDLQVTAIDLTPSMLEKARARAQELGLDVDLRLGDVQELEFPDETFDTVVSTCVFCSVPDPILGLHEVLRVLKPGVRLLMIEHVRSGNPLLGNVMDLLNPVVFRAMGPNINRHTVANVDRAGLVVYRAEDLGLGDIFKLIVARRDDHG
jgi:ubiquinone/menaquinone biosynthesis C-methylase UbiE